MAGLSSLPDGLIISEILHRLPIPSLLHLKHTNQHWFKTISDLITISDPIFAKSHLASQAPGRVKTLDGSTFRFTDAGQFYDLDLGSFLNETKLYPLHSRDGLLLLSTKERRFYIVNPVVRRYMKLPSTPPGKCDFGFLHFDDKNRCMVLAWTKVEQCTSNSSDIYVLEIQNHNHSNNVWQLFSPPKGLALKGYPPVVFNGWFYWITLRKWMGEYEWGILAFNLEIGEFRRIMITNREKGSSFLGNCRLLPAKECFYLVQVHVNCGMERTRNRFYIVSRYEDDLEEQSVNNNIYKGKVHNHTDSEQHPWEFRFACTSSEAVMIIDRYRSLKSLDLRNEIVHINSLVWEFSC